MNDHRVGILAVIALGAASLLACKASSPSTAERKVADETKMVMIGGKDWKNPLPATADSVQEGRGHFQHHCQICHGLDGQNTGVPFAEKMSPPVANLASKDVQQYSDGQLKWIIQNGIRYSGMPGWNGILEEEEMWNIVNYLRQLPPAGSLGAPAVFKESEMEHHEQSGHESKQSPHHR